MIIINFYSLIGAPTEKPWYPESRLFCGREKHGFGRLRTATTTHKNPSVPMILFYSSAFSIFGRQNEPAQSFKPGLAYDRLRPKILNWIEQIYRVPIPAREADNLDRQLAINSHIIAAGTELDGRKMWAMHWTRPDEDNPEFIRRLVIGLNETDEELEAGFSVYLLKNSNRVMPLDFSGTHAPPIVSEIVSEYQCAVGDEIIEPEPRPLDADDVSHFARELLADRILPIVLVAPLNAKQDRRKLAEKLAKNLVGQVHVAWLANLRALHFFNRVADPSLVISSGSIRLFWPTSSASVAEVPPPLTWLNSDLTNGSEEVNEGKICTAMLEQLARSVAPFFAQKFVQLDDIHAIRREKQHSHLNTDLEKTKVRLEKADRSSREWSGLLEQQNRNLAERVKLLEEELQQSKQGSFALKQKLQSLSQAKKPRAPSAVQNPGKAPRSVHEALELAADCFSDRLVVLPKAYATAEDSPYENVNEVFYALSALALDWFDLMSSNRSEGDIIQIFRSRSGFEYAAHESDVTTGMYESEYTALFENRKTVFTRHIKLGWGFDPKTCLRIHFEYFPDRKRIVIARCGVHPKNQRS